MLIVKQISSVIDRSKLNLFILIILTDRKVYEYWSFNVTLVIIPP